VISSKPYAPAVCISQEISLGLISARKPSRPQGHIAVEMIKSMTNRNYTIGNRNRELPTCSRSASTSCGTAYPTFSEHNCKMLPCKSYMQSDVDLIASLNLDMNLDFLTLNTHTHTHTYTHTHPHTHTHTHTPTPTPTHTHTHKHTHTHIYTPDSV